MELHTQRLAALTMGVVLLVSGGAFALVGSTGGSFQQQAVAGNAADSFEVSGLDAPNTTEPVDNLTVSATVSNPNDQRTTQVVKYRFDGTVLAQQFVTLDPGETTTVTFEADLTGVTSGEYVHGVFTQGSGVLATVTIPDSFRVTEVNAPDEASVGDQVRINATITNPNDIESTQMVEFRLDGELLMSQIVTLAPGESRTVAFDVETNGIAPGTYFHSVFTRGFGQFGQLTLTERSGNSPNATVSFTNQSSDGTVVVVESVTVTEGGFIAIHDASLFEGNVAGSVIGVSRYLEPGTYSNVTIELFEVPGGEFNTSELTEDQVLIAMPHFDSGDNERYDFVRTGGQLDGPYVADGGVVIDDATVSVGDSGGETETPPPDTDTATPAPNGTATTAPTDTMTSTPNGTATETAPGTTDANETTVGTDTGTNNATDTDQATGESATGTATGSSVDTGQSLWTGLLSVLLIGSVLVAVRP